jgi:hypothetical protein
MSSSKPSVLFVIYTLEMPDVRWTYTRLPKSWKWVGSGSTSPMGAKKLKYEREEQFEGAHEHMKPAREYLDYVFKQLKAKQVVKCYKIRNSYLP